MSPIRSLPIAACLALVANFVAAAVSWDEHEARNGVRWTAHATGRDEITLGSEREGVRAVDAGTAGTLKIPGSFKGWPVIYIGARAFEGLEGVTEVVVSDGVREIGEGAFAHCTGLEKLTLPESLIQIRAGAFRGCTSLRSLELPGGIYALEEDAFADCTGLTNVVFRPALENGREIWLNWFHQLGERPGGYVRSTWPVVLARRVFAGCTELKCVQTARWWELCSSVRLYPSNTSMVGLSFRDAVDVFSGCGTVGEVKFVGTVYHSRPLADIFPDAVATLHRAEVADEAENIPAGMFRDCPALEEVVLPDSVQSIADDAFADCPALREVTVPAELVEGDWVRQLPEGCRVRARGVP
jgi:hypothetical protein